MWWERVQDQEKKPAALLDKAHQCEHDKQIRRLTKKMLTEEENFPRKVIELQSVVCEMVESEDAASDFFYDAAKFKDILTHRDYLYHYVTNPKDTISSVILVIWKSPIEGPAMVHDNLCVLYFYNSITTKESCESFGAALPERVFTEDEMAEVARVNAIIGENQDTFFEQHSTLVAVRTATSEEDQIVIEFVVLAKGFVPLEDGKELPRFVEGVPTRVRTGIAMLCGKDEQVFHRPIVPGAGFGAGPEAKLVLNPAEGTPYVATVMGTLGGCYSDGEKDYAVTCAHCIEEYATKQLRPAGTPVYQPSAMGLIVSSLTANPHRKGEYDIWKSFKGEQEAMKWLLKQEEDLKTDLPDGAQCGTVRGGVLGYIPGLETAVDCALIELTAEMHPKCRPMNLPEEVVYPDLRLGVGSTAPLFDVLNPPKRSFRLYGQGAMSSCLMRADVNPRQTTLWYRDFTVGEGLGKLTYKCVHAAVERNWTTGDVA